MRFSVDHHFLIGQLHLNQGKPCQDYALSGIIDDAAYAVISDGCSSGGRTEVGACVMALSAEVSMKWCLSCEMERVYDAPSPWFCVRELLERAMLNMGLGTRDMLATCVQVLIDANGGYMHLEGDGVVAIKFAAGEINLLKYEWENNTPYYPIYALDIEPFMLAHGNDPKAKRLKVVRWRIDQWDTEEQEEEDISLADGIKGITLNLPAAQLEYIESVSIFSDGICQLEGVDWKTAVMEALSFKNGTGEFVKRRLNAFVKNNVKLNQRPMDDLSMATIRMEHV